MTGADHARKSFPSILPKMNGADHARKTFSSILPKRSLKTEISTFSKVNLKKKKKNCTAKIFIS